MDLTATYTFKAPVERVWDLLLDIDVVGSCIPGSKGLRPLGNDRYEVELSVAVSSISGDFKGTVELTDQIRPRSYTLLVDGSGRPGFVRGRTVVTLAADGPNTSVHIAAHTDVGGMIARVGQRLLEGVAKMTMDRFFACLANRI